MHIAVKDEYSTLNGPPVCNPQTNGYTAMCSILAKKFNSHATECWNNIIAENEIKVHMCIVQLDTVVSLLVSEMCLIISYQGKPSCIQASIKPFTTLPALQD